jgi:hypothetical protein
MLTFRKGIRWWVRFERRISKKIFEPSSGGQEKRSTIGGRFGGSRRRRLLRSLPICRRLRRDG